MSDYIPPEVLVEILLRLPAMALARCSCVSKSWYSLISSPDFICLYTNFTSNNLRRNGSSNSTQLFIRYYSRTRGKELFHLHADADRDDDPWGCCQMLDCPIKSSSGGYLEIVGSCYGLVCLTDTSCETGIQQYMGRSIIVWNPSAGKSIMLPSRLVADKRFLGFGFDFKTNDFKVVSILGVRRIGQMDFEIVGEVDIFALREGSWRSTTATVAPARSLMKYPSSQAYVNGNIHWIGHHDPVDTAAGTVGKLVVIVFDLGDEVFRELEMPCEVADGYSTCSAISIVKLGDSLSLVQYFKKDRHLLSYNACCIWVMHKYGMAESWTKDYSICPPGGVGKILWPRRNNEILMVTSCGELVSVDPECQIVNRRRTYGVPCSFYVDAYMESLVFTKYWFLPQTTLSSSTGTIMR